MDKLGAATFLLMMVVGACVALLGVNLYHAAANCPQDNPDAIEAHYEALSYRLGESEAHVQWQISALNKIVRHLQSQLAVLGRSEFDDLLLKAEEEAVILALRLAEDPAPAMSWEVEQEKYKDSSSYGYGSGSSSGGDYDYISKYGGNFTDDKSAYAWDDDWLLDLKKYNNSQGAKNSNNDKFGGLERDDDDLFGKSVDKWKKNKGKGKRESEGRGDDWDDEYDDPAEEMASEEKEGVFRDGMSDSDARHMCQGWQSEHSVKLGQDWGTLPFDLQQKWNQYACDYLLKS